jgi:hypothetical protein
MTLRESGGSKRSLADIRSRYYGFAAKRWAIKAGTPSAKKMPNLITPHHPTFHASHIQETDRRCAFSGMACVPLFPGLAKHVGK